MKYPYWSALEGISSLAAAPVTWKQFLGPDYEIFKSAFLDPAPRPAIHYPCPGCPCLHEVVHRQDGGISAHCRCNPSACPPIPLQRDDIAGWQLSWTALVRSLRKCLQLAPSQLQVSVDRTLQIGSWSEDLIPVFITINYESHFLQSAVAELGLRLPSPFILFGPTKRLLTTRCLELLKHARAAYFDLASTIRLTEHGALICDQAPGSLFAAFTPQPKELPEDVARRAFALASRLDARGRMRPPTPLTVFRMYCVDEMTAERIARKCRCSKTTVLNRLQSIRSATGMNPGQLRAYSAHLANLDPATLDSRAKRIRPHALIEDPDAEPGDEI
jgi:hypothetical protein